MFESYTIQLAIPEAKYEEKLKFWEQHGINCFERWTVPYFMEREKERKRPCLRLNYPPDGKCNDCVKGSCRYDKICFMCGQEGHGAFQSFSSGKMRGEMKCSKHRTFLSQMAAIREQYGLNEEDVMEIFQPKIAAEAAAGTAAASISATNATVGVSSTPSSPIVTSPTPPSVPTLAPTAGNPSASPVLNPNVNASQNTVNPNANMSYAASISDTTTNIAPKLPSAASIYGFGIDDNNNSNSNWNQSLSVSSILNGSIISNPNGPNPSANPTPNTIAPPGVSQYSAWGNSTSSNPTPTSTNSVNSNIFSIGGILTASPPPKTQGLGFCLLYTSPSPRDS